MSSGFLFSWTDPKTGAPYPQAFLTIEDSRVHLAAGLAILGIAIYATQQLYAEGKDPLYRDPDFYMTGAEIAAERDKFLTDLYGLLVARPEFTGATIVT